MNGSYLVGVEQSKSKYCHQTAELKWMAIILFVRVIVNIEWKWILSDISLNGIYFVLWNSWVRWTDRQTDGHTDRQTQMGGPTDVASVF